MHTKGRRGRLYLHGDICYSGGGQVKVLLDQNVEFRSQVSPSAHAVNLTSEQWGDLQETEVEGGVIIRADG